MTYTSPINAIVLRSYGLSEAGIVGCNFLGLIGMIITAMIFKTKIKQLKPYNMRIFSLLVAGVAALLMS